MHVVASSRLLWLTAFRLSRERTFPNLWLVTCDRVLLQYECLRKWKIEWSLAIRLGIQGINRLFSKQDTKKSFPIPSSQPFAHFYAAIRWICLFSLSPFHSVVSCSGSSPFRHDNGSDGMPEFWGWTDGVVCRKGRLGTHSQDIRRQRLRATGRYR